MNYCSLKAQILQLKSLTSAKALLAPVSPLKLEAGPRSGVHSGASSWAPSGDRAIGPPYVTGLRWFLAQIHERKDPWEMQYHASISQKHYRICGFFFLHIFPMVWSIERIRAWTFLFEKCINCVYETQQQARNHLPHPLVGLQSSNLTIRAALFIYLPTYTMSRTIWPHKDGVTRGHSSF